MNKQDKYGVLGISYIILAFLLTISFAISPAGANAVGIGLTVAGIGIMLLIKADD